MTIAQAVQDGKEPLNQRDDAGDDDLMDNGQAATKAFKNWFGDSKVVDAEGRPLVVYHGTNASFDTFDFDKTGSKTDDALWARLVCGIQRGNIVPSYQKAAGRDALADLARRIGDDLRAGRGRALVEAQETYLVTPCTSVVAGKSNKLTGQKVSNPAELAAAGPGVPRPAF